MGLDNGQSNEKPVHLVYLDEFWIMQTEVTNAQYAQCVDTGWCTPPGNERWAVPAFANYPVTGVNWSQANAYAEWVGGRLPTEAEWEKAARGADGRVYPWGNEKPDRQRTNFNAIIGFTMPVGSYLEGASPYGIFDMAGNVEEWVADWYDENYYATSPSSNPVGPAAGTLRVLRGGSFRHNLNDIRSSVRVNVLSDSRFDTVGFRIVVSAPTD
jgi:formylglycine-generating enzyme required for sulfatase activity